MEQKDSRPLCFDLDGTLIATDMLWESLILLIKHQPLAVLLLPLWICRGKAYVKRQLANRTRIRPETLPYRASVIAYIKAEQFAGRTIVLATGSDARVAEPIAQYLGLFSEILASDGVINLSGHNKLHALEQRFGVKGYDYVGNSSEDIPIWNAAHSAILTSPSGAISAITTRPIFSGEIETSRGFSLTPIAQALRIYQWVKNLLLFVPLALAHKLLDMTLLQHASIGFLSFGCCASGIYVLNDLLDLEADRLHPRKSRRPFASGALSIPTGILLASTSLLMGIGIASIWLPHPFVLLLLSYVMFSLLYCLKLKKVVVADVIGLAMLYSIRVLAGGEAAGVQVSQWLLTFSMFFFVNLAFMKRFSELYAMQLINKDPEGRPYATSDLEMIRSIGPCTGYISILVLALYINSQEVTSLYKTPHLLWLTGLAMLYWNTRMWFLAARGQMTDDPIIAAVQDYRSYVAGLFILLVIWLAI